MQITARVHNSASSHEVVVSTAGTERALAVPGKSSGSGSAVNGGEFLMLALATCYCNDLYREAASLGVHLERVKVEASAEFPGIGLAANNITYYAEVSSPASEHEIAKLLRQTDAVAEVHNTLRAGVQVKYEKLGISPFAA
jgi:uncharacterized OsmC-like protein